MGCATSRKRKRREFQGIPVAYASGSYRRAEPLDLSPRFRYLPSALRLTQNEGPIVQQSAKSLVWLVLMALLPGCALFGGGSTSMEAKKIYDRNDSPYGVEPQR